MRKLIGQFLAAILLITLPAVGHAQSRINTTLTSEFTRPAPGQTLRFALRMSPLPGWHGYWENPGDSGMPTTVKWDLPEGFSVSPLRYPAPITMSTGGLIGYVLPGAYTLLADLKVPLTATAGQALPIKANVRWVACSDSICVPEKASFSLELIVGNNRQSSPNTALFDKYEDLLPRPLQSAGKLTRLSDGVEIRISAPALDATKAVLFASDDDLIAPSATQSVRKEGGDLVFKIAANPGDLPKKLTGVITTAPGSRGYTFSANPSAPAPAAKAALEPLPAVEANVTAPALPEVILSAPGMPDGNPVPSAQIADVIYEAPSTVAREKARLFAFFPAFIAAVIGGLLLNLMPCVFPILSLKALSLARSGQSQTVARKEAVAYATGTILACLGLGTILLILRALGSEVGWAFQLQEPAMILTLAILTGAIGLNLLGAFELPSFSGGANFVSKKGSAGAFWTGILSAFIATPCSGPFMGVALGSALVLPTPSALAIFAGLGFGLGLPFLLVGLIPALRRRLPKPGPWMVTFRRILALPMLATAAALAWVLGRQTGNEGAVIALLMLLVTFTALTWTGLRQRRFQRLSWAPAVLILVLGSVALGRLPAASPEVSTVYSADGSIQPFSAAALADLRRRGVPVFVDFTADWCLTCKVNEKLAINRDDTRAAFKKAGVVTLIGDWTNEDPEISRFLADHGRNSIPFYLYYAPGAEAKELPQILTPSLLIGLPRIQA